MATQRLIIDGNARGQILLRVDGETVTIGDGDGARVLGSLRVERIRCVLDIDSDGVTVDGDDPPRAIRPGEVIESDGCRVRLEGAAGAAASKTVSRRKKRLLATAGPDEGRDFLLPDDGIVTLGRDRNQVDIVLRGLRVERVHCHLKIDGDTVEAMDEGKLGTQINGRRFARQEMKAGDILKIDGNQLRLEMIGPGEEFPVAVPKHQAPPVEAADETEADLDEPVEPPPAGAPEPARLLHEWRLKLSQLAGQTIGHYKLGSFLGRGRFGVVFRADDENDGQTLALKLLSPQFPASNPELQRFAGVVKALLPLRHDHIVGLVAAGKNPPYTWLAREFVEGENLARVIRRQQRDEEYDTALAGRVALHVARALVFARQHRLQHGALTPARILIRKGDQVVKLADLMLDAALAGSGLATAVQAYRTPAEVAYLSPEQATPGAFVDESSDLYALGAVLYALLTGRPPFLGKTAEEMLAQIRGKARVERPTTLNRGVPAKLEAAVMKLLAKHPEDRYATPAELLSDLEPIAAQLGVEE